MRQIYSLTVLSAACAFLAFATPLAVHAETAAATVTCKDGSTSKSGKGACSHHGGVMKDAASSKPAATESAPPAPKAAAPSTESAPRSPASSTSHKTTATASATSAAGPEGATARCKDGTYS